MHDLNNDTLLDGLEILSALTHMLPFEELYAKTGSDVEEKEDEKQFKTAEELKAATDKRRDEAMEYYTSESCFKTFWPAAPKGRCPV